MKNEVDALNKSIVALKEKQQKEQLELIKHMHLAYESLEPINIIKNTLKQISSSPEIKKNLVSSAVGVGTGFILKKLWENDSKRGMKQAAQKLLRFAVSSVLSLYADGIKSKVETVMDRYFKNKH